MPKFSRESIKQLETCHPDLQSLAYAAIEIINFKVIQGHRSFKEQQVLYAKGRTKPGKIVTQIDGVRKQSKHNADPSTAFDYAPWPINWDRVDEFIFQAGVFFTISKQLGIKIRWGGDWDMDHNLYNEKFRDWGHIELI